MMSVLGGVSIVASLFRVPMGLGEQGLAPCATRESWQHPNGLGPSEGWYEWVLSGRLAVLEQLVVKFKRTPACMRVIAGLLLEGRGSLGQNTRSLVLQMPRILIASCAVGRSR